MARLLKILLLLLAAFVGVGVLASIALFLFFDPNDFRGEISDRVKQATGRDLVIEGDISLSVFPWIAIEIGRTRLGNAAGFDDDAFLSFEEARLSVRLLPLLFKQEVAVGTASIDSLAVNLQVNRAGVSNWDDLADAGEASADAPAGDETASSGTFDIANISVANASVSYTDAQAGSRSSITGLTLATGRIAVGSPFDLDAQFAFETKPADIGGELSISGTFLLGEGMARIDIEDLNVSGSLDGVAAAPTEFSFDARAMTVDTSGQIITPGEMDLGILGLSMTARVAPFSYAGEPQPKATLTVHEFSLKELLQTLGEQPPETADANALQRVSFSANAAVGPKAIALTDMQLRLDDTSMVGTLSLPLTDDGALLFELALDSIVLDQYMAPSSEAAQASAGADDSNVEIPVDMIRALNARGKFTMEQATLSGIVFENLELGLNSENGKLRLFPITAEMFEGAYQGDVRIDAAGDQPIISVNENIVDVQLSALAKAMFGVDNVSGAINGTFVLSGRGADMDAIRRDLGGKLSFTLADGEWQGTDVWYELRKARASLKQETPPEPRLPARTEFTSVAASGTVTNGVMENRDFLAELPFLRLTGQGKVDFVQASLDYAMDARVVDSPEFAGQVSAAELQDFTSAVIPLRIRGPLASPSITPDIETMLRREIEKQIDQKADDLINRLLGSKNEPADGETADEQSNDGENNEEPDAEDLIKDALKNIFKE
jgi:AsmA protein